MVVDSFTLNKVEFDAVRRILAEFCRTSPGKSLALRIGPVSYTHLRAHGT